MLHYVNFKDANFFYHLLEARYQNLATERKKHNVKHAHTHTDKKKKKIGVETRVFLVLMYLRGVYQHRIKWL